MQRSGGRIFHTLLMLCCSLFLLTITNANASSTENRGGVHIPWAIGGERIVGGAHVYWNPEWPQSLSYSRIRLWDTRTAWLNVEPKNDTYNWGNLDQHVGKATAQGIQHITLVLWGTPTWATNHKTTTAAPWMGEGSASPPDNLSDWEDYVKQVVSRYAGKIHAYQIGNEPNLPLFWNGTPYELAVLTDTAARIIKTIDPQAEVIVSGPVVSGVKSNVSIAEGSAHWKFLAQWDTPLEGYSWHYYPVRLKNASQNFLRVNSVIQRKADEAGFKDIPAWLTEVGLPYHAQSSDFRSLRRTFNTAIDEGGISFYYWYSWGTRNDNLRLATVPSRILSQL